MYTLLFNRFYIGSMPMLKVTDVDMLKQILVKEFDSFSDRPVSVTHQGNSIIQRGVVTTRKVPL